MKVTFNGREVRNPVGRALIISLMPLVVAVGLVVALASMFVVVPILLALHPIFRLFGRVGTYRNTGNKIEITLDGNSFRRL